MRWTRAKYAGKSKLSMAEMRRRFCDVGWRFAHDGGVHGRIQRPGDPLPVRRSSIPTPWAATGRQQWQQRAEDRARGQGAPGAVRAARRVRRGDHGKPPAATRNRARGPTRHRPGHGVLRHGSHQVGGGPGPPAGLDKDTGQLVPTRTAARGGGAVHGLLPRVRVRGEQGRRPGQSMSRPREKALRPGW